jgi:hypothetical protein
MIPNEDTHEDQTDAALDRLLDQALTRALEARPHLQIADDFALRVTRKLPTRHPAPRLSLTTVPSTGRRVAFATLGVLFLAMILLAPLARGAGRQPFEILEWILVAEFILITVWMSLRPHPLR